jgi:hypothetical protein
VRKTHYFSLDLSYRNLSISKTSQVQSCWHFESKVKKKLTLRSHQFLLPEGVLPPNSQLKILGSSEFVNLASHHQQGSHEETSFSLFHFKVDVFQ